MPILIESLTLFILGLTTIVALMLYIFEYRQHQKELKELLTPHLDKAQQESREVLHQAVQKAEDIISEAETESIKALSDSRYDTKALKEEYEKQIAKYAQEVADSFKRELVTIENYYHQQMQFSQDQYVDYLTSLKGQTTKVESKSLDLAQQKVSALVDRFEQDLTDFFAQTQQKSLTSIELEIKSARELIDSYKQKQMMIVDENVVAVLERTLSLVLSKKLNLKDQIDLIYDSLEQAKVEKFIV